MIPDNDEQLAGCRSRIEMLDTENEILGRANAALRERVERLESLLRRAYSHVVTVFDVALGREIMAVLPQPADPGEHPCQTIGGPPTGSDVFPLAEGGRGNVQELCGACRKLGTVACFLWDSVSAYDESCDAFEDRAKVRPIG